MSLFDRFRKRPKSKQKKDSASTTSGTVPLTIQDIVGQIADQALIPSGDDTLVVDGFKAAAIVEKNTSLAKEAYEQLFHQLQTRTQTQDKATRIILSLTLTALAGGIANVTGDNSYVSRIGQLKPPK